MWDMLQQSFGWVLTAGYKTKQMTAPFKFPVLVGEVGASLDSEQVRQPLYIYLPVHHACSHACYHATMAVLRSHFGTRVRSISCEKQVNKACDAI